MLKKRQKLPISQPPNHIEEDCFLFSSHQRDVTYKYCQQNLLFTFQIASAPREQRISAFLSIFCMTVDSMAAEDWVDPCGFDTLFTKNVPHILEKIFFALDYESYNTCLKVSKAWNKLLTSEPYQQTAKSIFNDEILKYEDHLHLASMVGNKAEVERLLSYFLVDVNRQSAEGECTPLGIAAYRGHIDVVQLLLDRGADPNKENEEGGTQLHGAASGGHTDVVLLLLDRGADSIKSNKFGATPLQIAAMRGHKDVIQCFLDRGVDVNITMFGGGTPLQWAAIFGQTDVAEFLLDRGADPNIASDNGRTPLNHAATIGNKHLVQLLLDRGADANMADDEGKTPMSLAQNIQNTEIINLLTNPTA